MNRTIMLVAGTMSLIGLMVGCAAPVTGGSIDSAAPTPTVTDTPTRTATPTATPTAEPSNTPPPPTNTIPPGTHPAGTLEPQFYEMPYVMLIDSLHCDTRGSLEVYAKDSQSGREYVFKCLVHYSNIDYAFREVAIQRFSSQAEAEEAFYMAPGTPGDDHGFLVISSTDEDSFSWTWYYLGDRHIVRHEHYVPMPGFRTMTEVDIGFRLELFAEALNFVRSPTGTPTPTSASMPLNG